MIKIIIEEIKAIKSTRKELRNFGLVVGGVLFAIGAFLYWKERPAHPYFLIIGGVLAFAGLILPSILKPFQKVWMGFAVVMGFFMTRVILTILYFAVLTPISIAARIFGKKFMELKIPEEKESYWNIRDVKKLDKKDYERQF
ncbi:MAG: SxtJ family membrane protein [Thermodesulfobacteriota bacterium]